MKVKKSNSKLFILSISLIIVVSLIFIFSYSLISNQYLIREVTSDILTQYNYINEETSMNSLLNQCGDRSKSVLTNSVISKEVEINNGVNNWKFVAEKTKNALDFNINMNERSLSFGDNNYFFQKIDVYKNNNLYTTLTSYPISVEVNSGNRNAWEGKIFKIYDDDVKKNSYIEITMRPVGFELSDLNGPNAWLNTYNLNINNYFNVDVFTTSQAYVAGENITINIKIKNNLNQKVKANIATSFKIPTIFGFSSQIINKEVMLDIGDNSVIYSLPATKAEESIYITPQIELYLNGNNFKNLNYKLTNIQDQCNQLLDIKRMIGDSDWIKAGNIIVSEKLISISPKPLYINKIGDVCNSGYVESKDNTYCIREDVRNLTCSIIGCPTINGSEYYCTSSGVCAENVYINKECVSDIDCPINTKCDNSSGICFQKDIYENVIIKQCKINNDCIIPCEGKQAFCGAIGQCVYSGECKNIDYGCEQTGCPENYNCNSDNICVKKTNYILILVISFIIILFLIVIFLSIKKFTKIKIFRKLKW